MKLTARQGDLVFERMTVSGDLTTQTMLCLAGRDTAPHTIQGTVKARQEGTRWSIDVGDKPVTITHAGRHLPITLPAGWCGEVRVLRQGDDDRDVED